MSAKKKVLKNVFDNVFTEIIRNLPPDQASELEMKIESDLASKLGNNWAMLPVKGPYLMVLLMIFNYTLLPKGITPATITDALINKTKEYELDKKAVNLMDSVKKNLIQTGEYTSDLAEDITSYFKSKSEEINFSKSFEKELDNTKDLISSGIGKSKSLIKNLFNKNNEE